MKNFALIILGFWFFAILIGHFLSLNPNQVDLNAILSSANSTYLLGADDLGRSLLARLLVGAQTSLLVALIVTAITMLIGTTIGLISGFMAVG